MAILGKENVIEIVRQQRLPYWALFESKEKASAGNFIAKFNEESDAPSLEDSVDLLRRSLDRLTPGTYYLRAMRTPGATKNNVDCSFEIQSREVGAVAAIGSTGGGTRPLYLDGIGEVTAENFEQAIEAKFKKMQEEADRKKRELELQEENKRLKAELAEKESGINGGLYSIGAMFWPQIKNSGIAKDMLKTVAGLGFIPGGKKPAAEPEASLAGPGAANGNTTIADPQERIAAALGALLGDDGENPTRQAQLADELELLAKVKQSDPDTYEMGLGYLQNLGSNE